jgi:hypothetical protein
MSHISLVLTVSQKEPSRGTFYTVRAKGRAAPPPMCTSLVGARLQCKHITLPYPLCWLLRPALQSNVINSCHNEVACSLSPFMFVSSNCVCVLCTLLCEYVNVAECYSSKRSAYWANFTWTDGSPDLNTAMNDAWNSDLRFFPSLQYDPSIKNILPVIFYVLERAGLTEVHPV